jgi:hypothetical protein
MMTNHTKTKLAPWQFLFLFIASLGILTGLGNLTTIRPFLSANIAKASESEASVQQKLIGRWRVTENGQNADMVFTPEGKWFFLTPFNPPSYHAIEMNYKIDIFSSPNRLAFEQGKGKYEPAFEFEFIDGKLILDNILDDAPKMALLKISSSATLSEREIKSLETTKLGVLIINAQAEAKNTIGSLNRAQQAFYMEKGKFSNANVMNKSNELSVPIQSKYYNFKTSAKKDHAISVATIKDIKKYQFSQYVGMVFSNSNKTFSSIICFSNDIGSKIVIAYKNGKLLCEVGKEVK